MKSDALSKALFLLAIILVSYGYGFVSHRHNLFPVPILQQAREGGRAILDKFSGKLPFHYIETEQDRFAIVHDTDALAPGLTLISGVGSNDLPVVKVVDPLGQVVHTWLIDWFKIWPNPTHLRKYDIPTANPAGDVHGIAIMRNGDLVFSQEYYGLVRMDACGNVKWRVPKRTHHSLHVDEDGTLWVPGMDKRTERVQGLPNHKPIFWDYSILQISENGDVLRELNIFELLQKNGLAGLLYMSTLKNGVTEVTYDTLHLNDIETFPSTMPPGVFERGDIMISLRNINAVIVFNLDTQRIKFLTIGKFIRQHDPDFIDGNTISVFDNNNLSPDIAGRQSKIVNVSATNGKLITTYSGSSDQPFFTNIGGKHQRLPNGNILMSEYRKGRAFEITPSGSIVWEYFNIVQEGIIGVMTEAQRLPEEYGFRFFENALDQCISME